VYKAVTDSERVAVKLINLDKMIAIDNEIAMHTKCMPHPNVVRLRAAGRAGEYNYGMVMDYCDVSLHDLQGMLLAEDVLRNIAHQVLEGLSHVHERGVMHRDIKPANIMLNRAGRISLIDFGLACERPPPDCDPTTPDVVPLQGDPNRVTTCNYRPPELLVESHNVHTVKIDAWSVGVVLLELATGKSWCTGQDDACGAMQTIVSYLGGMDGDTLCRICPHNIAVYNEAVQKLEHQPVEGFNYHAFCARINQPRVERGLPRLSYEFIGLVASFLTMDPDRRASPASALADHAVFSLPRATDAQVAEACKKALLRGDDHAYMAEAALEEDVRTAIAYSTGQVRSEFVFHMVG
jgi:serine/threonine protein kinase